MKSARRRRRRRCPTAADRTGRLQRLPGAVRRAGTSTRRSAGTPNVVHNGYQVTDAAGNLVDLDGNEIQEPFSRRPASRGSARPRRSRSPCSPTCRRPASRSPTATSPTCTSARPTPAAARPATATAAGRPLGPGDSLLRHERPALRRRVPEVLRAARRGRHHAGEHAVRDQRRGERPVRRRERRPRDAADTGGLRRRHHAVQLRQRADRRAAGEHQGPARRAPPASSTQFDVEPQGAAIYVHGQPAANDPAVRQLERDTAAMTNPNDPYSGVDDEKITQVPGGRARAARPAPADGGSAADADVHAVPEAGLLLRDVSATPNVQHQHATSPTTTATTARTSTSPGPASSARAWRRTGSTDRRRPAATSRATRSRRRPCPRRAARDVGRGDRHPADDAAPVGPARRLPVGRPRHHAGPDVACRPRSRRRPTWRRATTRSTRASVSSRPTRCSPTRRRLASGSAKRRLRVRERAGRLRHLADKRDAQPGEMKAVLAKAAEGGSALPRHGRLRARPGRRATSIQAHQLASGH